MSTPTPGLTTPGTFLGREPLLWTAAVRAVLWAGVLMEWITLTDVQLGGLMLAVEAVLYLITRTQATPNVSVVERTANGGDVVVAGPANDKVEAGAVVRRIGDDKILETVPPMSYATEFKQEDEF